MIFICFYGNVPKLGAYAICWPDAKIEILFAELWSEKISDKEFDGL